MKESTEELPVYYNKLKILFLLTIIAYFILNFLGSSLLKPLFLILTIETFLVVLLLPWNISCLFLTIFLMVDGQGRTIWGYNPFFRINFDLLTFIAILKVFIKQSKIINLNNIPKVTLIFIILHFLWFFIELFNPQGPGVLASFVTVKYYIFPFMLFFCSMMSPIDFKAKETQSIIKFIIFFILLESVLALFQMGVGQDYFYQISPHFTGLFEKNNDYQGINYRAWGTTHVPGAYSILLFLMIGFLFLYRAKVRPKLFQAYTTIIILIATISSFASSVRSALIKLVVITMGAVFIKFIISKKKFLFASNLLLGLIIMGAIFASTLVIFPNVQKNLNLLSATTRLLALTEKGGVTKQRGSYDSIFNAITNQVEYPFGFGPGMCTNYSPEFKKTRKRLEKYKTRDYWTFDNLFVFVFLELGIGAIFYIGAILSLNITLLMMSFNLYIHGKTEEMFVTAFGALFTCFITLASWGAISIPFNPISFMYWFWCAQACHNYYRILPRPLGNKL